MIESAIKRKMLVAWTQTTVMLAIGLAPMYRDPGSRAFYFINVISFPIVFSLAVWALCLIVKRSEARRERHRTQRSLWREDYRKSPQSHVLHLND